MNQDTVNILLEVNRQFYQTFAKSFSATRLRLQPGVQQIIKQIPKNASILDLGCGNGELWQTLSHSGHKGIYIGLDLSTELLKIAKTHSTQPGQSYFIQADLASPDWDSNLPFTEFDVVFAFAVLHHLPNHALRLRILNKVHCLLLAEGKFYHSEWQFLNSPRLRARIQPWTRLGITEEQVDPNDYLLDWRQDGYGLRYVHHFSESELERLAQICAFKITDSFFSDGESGKLGFYQVWEPI